MPTIQPLLDLPAPIAARYLLLVQLEAADQAHRRLRDGSDAEALHNMRVAIRRLRTCIRYYRPHLQDAVGAKDWRQLRKLGALTDPARDLEVQITWLRAEADTLHAAGGPEIGWLVAALEQRLPAAYAGVTPAISAPFRKLRRRLRKKLATFSTSIEARRPPALPSCRATVSATADRLITKLNDRLAAIQTFREHDEAHRARLTAKRLRYLLEPFRTEAPGLDELIGRLRELQDLLGDMRDVDGLAVEVFNLLESLPTDDARLADLQFLLRRLHQRQALVFGELQAAWLGDNPAGYLCRLQELSVLLRARGGAGMEMEIERKFLLQGLPQLPEEALLETLEVEQGWLPGVRLLERVRRVRTPDGDRCYRAIKLGSGVSRVEIEEAMDDDLFASLWPLTRRRRVFKTRFKVEADGALWEIDRFRDRDLVLAEIELDSPDAPVHFPNWLSAHVVREVTDEPEYLNVNLAS